MSKFHAKTIGSKLYKTWLVSYLVIFIVPLLVGIFIYSKADRIILNEMINSNLQMIRQVKVTSDLKFEELDHLMLQIALNQKVTKFLTYRENLTEDQRYQVTQILKDFNVYINSNSFIDGYYVYCQNSRCVLSPFAKYNTADILPRIQIETEGQTAVLDEKYLAQRFTRQICSGTLTAADEEPREVLLYIQSLPYMFTESQGSILILIDKEKFFNIFQEIIRDNKQLLFIDQQDQILLSSAQTGFTAFDELHSTASMPLEIAQTDAYLFHMDSDILPLQYAMVIQIDAFAAQARTMKGIAIASCSICIIFSLGLAFLFARYNYNPVSELVNIVSSQYKSPGTKSNELLLIKNAILMTLAESDQVKQHLESQKPIIKKNFLQKLIQGSLSDESLEQDLAYCDINFQSDSFVVLIVHQELIKPESSERERTETYFLITGIFRNALEKYGTLYDIDADSEFICIINLLSSRAAIGNLKDILCAVQQTVKRRLSVELSIAFSEEITGIQQIHIAYGHARKAMEYRLVLGKGNILNLEDIEPITCDSPFTFDDKSRLLHAIAAGDRQSMRDLFDEIFISSQSGKYISIEIGRCLFYDMINTAIGIAKMHESDSRGASVIDTGSIDEMLRCATIQELKDKIIGIYEGICDHVAQNKKSRASIMVDMVTKYIDDHFADPELSVSGIAKYFYINSAYLGNFYKEHAGQNIIEAIGIKRICEAKRLMLTSNEKIKVISEKVGFVNINTFLRAFKRYEGITPQQFRQSG